MAIRQTPQTDSTPAQQARRDLISLSLAPIRQSLIVYSDIQRSMFETFSRFSPWGASILGASGEQPSNGARNGRATTAEAKRAPARASEPAAPTTKRPATPAKRAAAAKPTATKRAAATKPAATKRPTATKRAATKTPPKPAAKKADRGKPSAARKVASSRPPRARAGAGKKA